MLRFSSLLSKSEPGERQRRNESGATADGTVASGSPEPTSQPGSDRARREIDEQMKRLADLLDRVESLDFEQQAVADAALPEPLELEEEEPDEPEGSTDAIRAEDESNRPGAASLEISTAQVCQTAADPTWSVQELILPASETHSQENSIERLKAPAAITSLPLAPSFHAAPETSVREESPPAAREEPKAGVVEDYRPSRSGAAAKAAPLSRRKESRPSPCSGYVSDSKPLSSGPDRRPGQKISKRTAERRLPASGLASDLPYPETSSRPRPAKTEGPQIAYCPGPAARDEDLPAVAPATVEPPTAREIPKTAQDLVRLVPAPEDPAPERASDVPPGRPASSGGRTPPAQPPTNLYVGRSIVTPRPIALETAAAPAVPPDSWSLNVLAICGGLLALAAVLYVAADLIHFF